MKAADFESAVSTIPPQGPEPIVYTICIKVKKLFISFIAYFTTNAINKKIIKIPAIKNLVLDEVVQLVLLYILSIYLFFLINMQQLY